MCIILFYCESLEGSVQEKIFNLLCLEYVVPVLWFSYHLTKLEANHFQAIYFSYRLFPHFHSIYIIYKICWTRWMYLTGLACSTNLQMPAGFLTIHSSSLLLWSDIYNVSVSSHNKKRNLHQPQHQAA